MPELKKQTTCDIKDPIMAGTNVDSSETKAYQSQESLAAEGVAAFSKAKQSSTFNVVMAALSVAFCRLAARILAIY